jgi:hypothetical protein
MNDFFKGPDSWMQIDHEALHKDLYSRDEEKSGPLGPEHDGIAIEQRSNQATSMRDFVVALLTFGGSLIPSRMRSDELIAVPVQKRAIGASISHNAVIHRHPRQAVGFVTRRDHKRFWTLLLKVGMMALKIPFLYGISARRYRDAYDVMVSDESWSAALNKI